MLRIYFLAVLDNDMYSLLIDNKVVGRRIDKVTEGK